MPVTLTLGDFTFADTEIPESITMPTKQKVVVHRQIGGGRVIDTLGVDYDPMSWSGLLLGSDAMDRADIIQDMVEAGLPVTLDWSEYQYQVLVTEFRAEFEREYQIPYTIVCEILQDMANPLIGNASDSFDDLINGDMTTASTYSFSVGNSGLSGVMGTLQSAVSSVSSFASATKAQLNAVLAPLAQAQAMTQQLIASTDNTLMSVSTLGGIVPGNPVSIAVSKLTTQVNAMATQGNLLQLSGVLGRMGSNIGQIGGGSQSVMQAGGSLFDLASKYYGSVAGWTNISAANPSLGGETTLTGINTIIIPPYTPTATGLSFPPALT